jgi:endonuclease-8
MPEGPEVRREADAIARAIGQGELVNVEYRLPALARRAERLAGARVTDVSTRGKTMVIAFDRGLVHLSHHQLYGEWRVSDARRAPDSDRAVRVVLATAKRAAILYSATAIALVDADAAGRHPLVVRLGPDALDRSTTAAVVAARLADRRFARTTLGHLLLDQAFVAGLGNYLRSDILHVAGLRAETRPVDLHEPARRRLAAAIVALPRRSYRTRGITNDAARARALAGRGVSYDARRFLVYAREGEPCWTCGTPIRRRDAAGRGWFFCPRCQRSGGEGRR